MNVQIGRESKCNFRSGGNLVIVHRGIIPCTSVPSLRMPLNARSTERSCGITVITPRCAGLTDTTAEIGQALGEYFYFSFHCTGEAYS